MNRQHLFLDEDRIVDNLQRLVTEGRDGGFVTVSCGPHYFVQIVKNKDNYMRVDGTPLPPHLFWNVAGNESLPDNRQIADLQVAQLRMLGFIYPCSPHPDYGFYATGFVRVIEQFDRPTLAMIAHTTCHIFANIYRCPPTSRLRFELALRGLA